MKIDVRHVGILTISDRAYARQYEDRAGPIIRELVEGRLGWIVEQYAIVPDEREYIKSELVRWADVLHLDLILTTGGTGKFSCGGGELVCHSSPLAPHGFGPATGPLTRDQRR